MNTKEYDEDQKKISRLCANGEKVIESEYFNRVNYLIKDKHIIILAGKSGEIAIGLDKVQELTEELNEIYSMWKDIDTNNCVFPNGKKEKCGRKKLSHNSH